MSDRRTFFAVIVVLGITLLTCVAGIIGLTMSGLTAPDILENVTVGALTGLAGLLARGPSSDPQTVTVRQPADQPVPVTDEGHADVLAVLAGVVLVLLCLVLARYLGFL